MCYDNEMGRAMNDEMMAMKIDEEKCAYSGCPNKGTHYVNCGRGISVLVCDDPHKC